MADEVTGRARTVKGLDKSDTVRMQGDQPEQSDTTTSPHVLAIRIPSLEGHSQDITKATLIGATLKSTSMNDTSSSPHKKQDSP